MTNPLIDKYNELYSEKKDPPKLKEDCESKETISDISITKIKSYYNDDLKDAFFQVAKQLQSGKAQALSMNVEYDNMYFRSTKITFEVYVET